MGVSVGVDGIGQRHAITLDRAGVDVRSLGDEKSQTSLVGVVAAIVTTLAKYLYVHSLESWLQ